MPGTADLLIRVQANVQQAETALGQLRTQLTGLDTAMASNGKGAIGGSAESWSQMSLGIEGVGLAAHESIGQMSFLTDETRKAGGAGGAFEESAKSVQSVGVMAEESAREVGFLGEHFGRMASDALAFGEAFFAFEAVLSIVDTLKNAIIEFPEKIEGARITFETFTGSAALGAKVLDDIEGLTRRIPFGFDAIASTAQRLIALGAPAEEVANQVRDIAAAAAATNQGDAGLDKIAVALARIEQTGIVDARVMRQLTTDQIPAWQILAEGMHKTIPELQLMFKHGQITSEEFLKLFHEWASTTAGTALAQQADTISGSMQITTNNVQQLMSEGLQPLTLRFTEAAQASARFAQSDTPKVWAAATKGYLEDVLGSLDTSTARMEQDADRWGTAFAIINQSIPNLSPTPTPQSMQIGPRPTRSADLTQKAIADAERALADLQAKSTVPPTIPLYGAELILAGRAFDEATQIVMRATGQTAAPLQLYADRLDMVSTAANRTGSALRGFHDGLMDNKSNFEAAAMSSHNLGMALGDIYQPMVSDKEAATLFSEALKADRDAAAAAQIAISGAAQAVRALGGAMGDAYTPTLTEAEALGAYNDQLKASRDAAAAETAKANKRIEPSQMMTVDWSDPYARGLNDYLSGLGQVENALDATEKKAKTAGTSLGSVGQQAAISIPGLAAFDAVTFGISQHLAGVQLGIEQKVLARMERRPIRTPQQEERLLQEELKVRGLERQVDFGGAIAGITLGRTAAVAAKEVAKEAPTATVAGLVAHYNNTVNVHINNPSVGTATDVKYLAEQAASKVIDALLSHPTGSANSASTQLAGVRKPT